MAKEKSRNFTFLLYPDGEGFPKDWEERLEKIGVPIGNISKEIEKLKKELEHLHSTAERELSSLETKVRKFHEKADGKTS